MKKAVAVIQSSYIPWKGYFDIIRSVDEFIIYDEVQYSKNSWRNRNKIKTPRGIQWLTIPIQLSGNFGQNIKSVKIADNSWNRRHWEAIKLHYEVAPHFKDVKDFLKELFLSQDDEYLSKVNYNFLKAINSFLEIKTPITDSEEYSSGDKNLDRNERLISICKAAGATTYLSGPSAMAYIDMEAFAKANIEIRWANYDGYAEYQQCHGPFEHEVTIIDLICNKGDLAHEYMKLFK